jgi:hypothetical protein
LDRRGPEPAEDSADFQASKPAELSSFPYPPWGCVPKGRTRNLEKQFHRLQPRINVRFTPKSGNPADELATCLVAKKLKRALLLFIKFV